MTQQTQKQLIFEFLDELQNYQHNERRAELIRYNFGLSWSMIWEYIAIYDEKKGR